MQNAGYGPCDAVLVGNPEYHTSLAAQVDWVHGLSILRLLNRSGRILQDTRFARGWKTAGRLVAVTFSPVTVGERLEAPPLAVHAARPSCTIVAHGALAHPADVRGRHDAGRRASTGNSLGAPHPRSRVVRGAAGGRCSGTWSRYSFSFRASSESLQSC